MTRLTTHPLASLVAAILTITLFAQTVSVPTDQTHRTAAYLAELA